jgi:hypothetical protein
MEGHEPTSHETFEESFSTGWFAKFPTAISHTPGDYAPTGEAPRTEGSQRAGTWRADHARAYRIALACTWLGVMLTAGGQHG